MITLKNITILDDNMKDCIALDIAPEKKDYIVSNAMMLAVAHRRYQRFSQAMACRAIYKGSDMVGLITYNYYVDSPMYKETCYRIWPIMVDKRHGDKGYEAEALQLLLAELRTKPCGEATAIFACHSPKYTEAATLYAAAGFAKTDLTWDDPDDEDVIVRLPMESPHFTTRIIQPTDYPACAHTLIAAFKEAPWNENWTFESAHTRIAEMMASPMSRGYVIWDEGTIVAMCIGRIMTYLDFKELFVDELSVHPSYQKQGLGGKLLAFAKEALQAEGVFDMVLNTEKGSPAVKFYEKNGFNPLDKIVMMHCNFRETI